MKYIFLILSAAFFAGCTTPNKDFDDWVAFRVYRIQSSGYLSEKYSDEDISKKSFQNVDIQKMKPFLHKFKPDTITRLWKGAILGIATLRNGKEQKVDISFLSAMMHVAETNKTYTLDNSYMNEWHNIVLPNLSAE